MVLCRYLTISRFGEVLLFSCPRNLGAHGLEVMKLTHAFEYLNLRKIYLEVLDFNLSAKKAYEKFGFLKEGTLSQHVYLANQYYDLHIMSLFKADYYENR